MRNLEIAFLDANFGKESNFSLKVPFDESKTSSTFLKNSRSESLYIDKSQRGFIGTLI